MYMEIYLQARGSYETLLDLSIWCESNNIKRIGLPDHYIVGKQRKDKNEPAPALDLLTAIAGLVRDTESMIYSVLVSPITFRHPSVLLKMATTINEMAKKRLRLGVGTGWLEIEHEVFGIDFPDLKTRFEMLHEALEYITQGMFGENKGMNGKYYQLDNVPILPSAQGEVPIIIGGGGKKKTPTLAGKYADEFNIYAGPEDVLKNSIDLFYDVANENNRDVNKLEVSTACPPVVGFTKDEVDQSLIDAAKSLIQPKDEIAKNWKDRSYLYGTPEEISETIGMWKDAGIQSVYLQLLDLDKNKRENDIEVIRKAVELAS